MLLALLEAKMCLWVIAQTRTLCCACAAVVTLDGPKQSVYSLDMTRSGSLVLAGTSENVCHIIPFGLYACVHRLAL
jgi:hypothetical protein